MKSDPPPGPVAFPDKDQCPNCGRRGVCVVSHSCGERYLGVLHCGCFYEEPFGQGDCVAHDCRCEFDPVTDEWLR